jgi:DNA-binding beta-propeller fold protein YncE
VNLVQQPLPPSVPTDEAPDRAAPASRWWWTRLGLLVALMGLYLALARSDGAILYVGEKNGTDIIGISSASNTHGQFVKNINFPTGMVFDSAGNLYVAINSGNNTNGTIEKYSSSGAPLGTIVSAGTLNQPQGLAMDKSGNLYVANNGANSVVEYSSSGTLIRTITGLNKPTGLTFDSSGNKLYVANSGANTILQMNPDGTGQVTWAGSSLVSTPEAIAFGSDGFLYVANNIGGGANSDFIEKITAQNTGIQYAKGAGVNNPIGIAFDSGGNLYVANQGTKKIEVFTTDTKTGTGTDDGAYWNLGLGDNIQYLAFQPLGPLGVPAPSALVLAGLGAAALLGRAWRRRRKSPPPPV